jgi:hypothetical protein
VTTQSTHLYSRRYPGTSARQRGAGGRGDAAGEPGAGPGHLRGGRAGRQAQTRLPWWALALPVAAFVTLLMLLSGGSADASTPSAAPAGLAHLAAALGALVHHLL